MDIVQTFIGSIFLMLLLIYIFKDNYNRIRSQIIAISILVILLIATNYYKYFNIISAIRHFIPIMCSYIISLIIIFYKTNFFRRMKFKHNKSMIKVDERMPKSSVYRKKYILSIIGLIIINIIFIGLLIYDFTVIYLICLILSIIFNIIYIINMVKLGVFKKEEPIRKLVVLVNINNKLMILSKEDNNEQIFDLRPYLDNLREEYFVLPVAEVFYTNLNYEVHKVFMIKTDSFNNKYDLILNDPNLLFYKDVFKKLEKNIIKKFAVVKDENNKVVINEL